MDDDASGAVKDVNEASDLEKADVGLGEKVARHRNDPAVKAAAKAAKIGDQGPLYALSAGLLLLGFFKRDRRLAGSGIAMFAAIALTDLSKTAVKHLVKRTRPDVLLDEKRYESEAGGSEEKPEQSFPSGHTAGSMAVARALSRNYPFAGAAAGVAAVAIGVSRVAKGAHWPLDVAAGAIIGLAAEAVSAELLELGARNLTDRIPDEYLPVFRTTE